MREREETRSLYSLSLGNCKIQCPEIVNRKGRVLLERRIRSLVQET